MPPLAACDRDFLLAINDADRGFISIEAASRTGGGHLSG